MSFKSLHQKRAYDKQYHQKSKGTPAHRYRKSKEKAKKRQLTFTLTLMEFTALSSQPCVYCQEEMMPKNHQVMQGSHLDRIDNTQGYSLENVVSCCQVCNSIRNQFLTPAETHAAVKAILKLRHQKNSQPVPKKKAKKKSKR